MKSIQGFYQTQSGAAMTPVEIEHPRCPHCEDTTHPLRKVVGWLNVGYSWFQIFGAPGLEYVENKVLCSACVHDYMQDADLEVEGV